MLNLQVTIDTKIHRFFLNLCFVLKHCLYEEVVGDAQLKMKVYAQNNKRKCLHLSISNSMINASLPMMNKC